MTGFVIVPKASMRMVMSAKPPDFSTKILCQWPSGASSYQPDQSGALLFAMAEHFKNYPENKNRYLDLIKDLADGTCKAWAGDHFNAITNDLWEERHTYPDLRDNFSYTLAACAGGLRAIHELLPDRRYIVVSTETRGPAIGRFSISGWLSF